MILQECLVLNINLIIFFKSFQVSWHDVETPNIEYNILKYMIQLN